jgi:hypothetical protein
MKFSKIEKKQVGNQFFLMNTFISNLGNVPKPPIISINRRSLIEVGPLLWGYKAVLRHSLANDDITKDETFYFIFKEKI